MADHVAPAGITASQAHVPWGCYVDPHQGLFCRDALDRVVQDPELLSPAGCGPSPLLNDFENNTFRIPLCKNALGSHQFEVEFPRYGGELPAANQ